MKEDKDQTSHIQDAINGNWVDNHAPEPFKPILRLMRLDRPVGIWLLLLPALWGIVLAGRADVAGFPNIKTMILFTLGAILMRSAGCVYNDIIDKDLDKKVARTKARPLACGVLSTQAGVLLLISLLGLGFMILLQFNSLTIWLGALALLPIALYPFGKRFIWWPQAVLGLCFAMAPLLGWTAIRGAVETPALLLMLATLFWTIGFDTIYAHQDKEDDALIGIKSTALKFGEKTPTALMVFYGLTLICLFAAGWMAGASLIFFTALTLGGMQLAWQIGSLNLSDGENCLVRFRSNQILGLIILGGLVFDMILGGIIGA